MKTFEVTMDIWRESFSGHDYFDYAAKRTLKARNSQSAVKKATKEVLDPGKGKRWSQSLWVNKSSVKEI